MGKRLTGSTGLESWSVVAVTAVLTMIMAWPVLVAPAERLFGTEIIGRVHDPFTMISYFENPSLPSVRTQPLTDYPAALAASLTGSGVVAYNLIVLCTFPLAALTAFFLARFLTDSSAAAWIAGVAYAFLPFHLAHAGYHPHIAQVQWLPLYFLALWLSLERSSPARYALLALAATFVALSNFYNGLIAGALTPFAAISYWYFVARRRDEGAGRRLALTAVALVMTGLAGCAYVLFQAPAVFSDPGSLAFPREDLFRYTARWYAYFVPAVENGLFGTAAAEFWSTRSVFNGVVEQQVSIGFGLTALSGVALLAWWRGPRRHLVRGVPVLAIPGLMAFVLSLPPEWTLAGLRVPGPTAILFELVPMFRAHARFGLFVGLAAAVLGSIGAVTLLRTGSRAARASATVLLLLVVAELAPFPPWRWRDVLPTSAHRWLQERPVVDGRPVSVLDCVEYRPKAADTLPELFVHPLRIAGEDVDCGQPNLAASLLPKGITHVIVGADGQLDSWLRRDRAPSGMEVVETFEDATLFAVEARAPEPYLEFGDGFYRREYGGGLSFRWMRRMGSLALVNPTDRTRSLSVTLTLHAFPGRRDVAVDLDGREIARLRVGPRPSRYVVAPLEIDSGRHSLELRTREPAVSPMEATGSSDSRPLTIALGDWSVEAVPESVAQRELASPSGSSARQTVYPSGAVTAERQENGQ